MMKRIVFWLLAPAPIAALAVSGWLAYPPKSDGSLPAGLKPAAAGSWEGEPYSVDANALEGAFESQVYRSFCGPASIATVLRAYGAKDVDQRNLFPSILNKLGVFYSGMTLDELHELAGSTGLESKVVYAEGIALDAFRSMLKENVNRAGDYVLVNYDRKALNQSGGGHISAIGAYDESNDSFLVLDQAAYKYPFTWVPTNDLYDAARTRDGDKSRGLLIVTNYHSR